jgi:hypothetical protein
LLAAGKEALVQRAIAGKPPRRLTLHVKRLRVYWPAKETTHADRQFFQQDAGGGPPPEQLGWIMLGMYGGMGLIALVAGGLHLFAGIRTYRFRSRTLGFVALGGGLAALFTCYCAPSAIARSVNGLITYMNPEVAQAFAMGDAGKTREEIFAAFP